MTGAPNASDPRVQTLRHPRFKLQPFHGLTLGTEPPHLIKGLIPRVGITVVWGPPKSGKSFWTFDLVMHVALGWEYRDRPVRSGAVVYVAFEGAHGFHARAEAFRRELLPDTQEPFPFYLIAADAHLERDHTTIISDIRSQMATSAMPVCVVLDTLNRSLGGDENAGKDMTGYINAAGAISSAFECAVIIVHHCGHDNSRMRGFSGLGGNTDCQIAVKRDPAGVIAATVVAAKDMPEGTTILSRLKLVVVGTDAEGDPVESCVIEPVEGAPAPKTRKWSQGLTVFRDALTAALLEHAQEHRPCGDGPVVKAVILEHVRNEHRRLYVPTGDGDRSQAERAAWSRNFKHARNRRLICGEALDDGRSLIWLTTETHHEMK